MGNSDIFARSECSIDCGNGSNSHGKGKTSLRDREVCANRNECLLRLDFNKLELKEWSRKGGPPLIIK